MNDVYPTARWDHYAEPADAGYDSSMLLELEARLRELPTTSFLVVQNGKIVFSYGDISRASYLASCRKSVLSLLYGRHIASGAVDLKSTIEAIGIDEVDGLTNQEKQATVHQILLSSSGVFYPPGSPGSDLSNFPARGSHPAGYFYYSNWDFNAAGEIYRKLTGCEIHDALEAELAIPLGFEDFDRSRQRMLKFPSGSQFPAYHMFLSARDMARIGLMVARKGKWGGRQIVPEDWIEASTRMHVQPQDMHGAFKDGPMGYGYYWWTPVFADAAWKNSFLALGHFGQMILGLPATDTVIVHRRSVSDERVVARHLNGDTSEPSSVDYAQFLDLAQLVIGARV